MAVFIMIFDYRIFPVGQLEFDQLVGLVART